MSSGKPKAGIIDPAKVPTTVEPPTGATEADEHFDSSHAGWIETELTLLHAAG